MNTLNHTIERTTITYGTFDLFHIGHLRILQRAKQLAMGGKLIVGVTSENYDRERGKLNVIDNLMTRIENVKKTGLVDLVLVEEYEGQKIEDIKKYNIDLFVIGSDWKGKYDYLNEYCDVVYLDRTPGISSTAIRNSDGRMLRGGIVGSGRIATRFITESRFVSGISFDAVFNPNSRSAEVFSKKFSLKPYFSDFEEFLEAVDVVYIATPHVSHFVYARQALLRKKHVLCEKPLALCAKEAEELYRLANENGVILTEAIKTAFAPGFIRMVSLVKSGIIGHIFDVDATFTKILPTKQTREFDKNQGGGATSELASYVLCPIIKILGIPNIGALHCQVLVDPTTGVDGFTSGILEYLQASGKFKIAITGKSEGCLTISGESGYVYVPAPWWKTEYFEIRNDEGRAIKRYFHTFAGEGLRYELADFVKNIVNCSNVTSWSAEESIASIQILEAIRSRIQDK